MDFTKLRLDKFKTYNGFQLPNDFTVPLQYCETAEVFFVFLTSFEELNRYTNIIRNNQRNTENRIFYIYPKGQKNFHAGHLRAYFKKAKFLVMKAPMLCSLDETYSCFTCMIKE